MNTKIAISRNVTLDENEISISAIRAQGAGGQNVNKLSTAIHLRFDIKNSSLPEFYKQRLLALKDQRITRDGVIVIKSQRYRSQDKNRQDAITRLVELIRSVAINRKKRIPTSIPKSVDLKRREQKQRRGKIKAGRKKIQYDD
jgi:ribosome-associated protein